MAKSAASSLSPVALIWGEDEFTVKQRAKEIYQQWCAELGGTDQEIIDAAVNNSGEALKSLAKLREALQTLPFFGNAKAVWFQNCNFLGDERAASSQSVSESLAELAEDLKEFREAIVRLKEKQGLYIQDNFRVAFIGKSLFRATIELPANVTVGPFETRVYLFREEKLLSQYDYLAAKTRDVIHRRGQPKFPAAVRPGLSRPFVTSILATNRPAPSRSATPWATATCRGCSVASMKNFGS